MSAADGPTAPAHPLPLIDHARRLLRLTPDGPLPNGGQPLPPGSDPAPLSPGSDPALLSPGSDPAPLSPGSDPALLSPGSDPAPLSPGSDPAPALLLPGSDPAVALPPPGSDPALAPDRPGLPDVLREFLADPRLSARDLHDRCAQAAPRGWKLARDVQESAAEPTPRLLDAARWLLANGTDRSAVLVGLHLLDGHAEPRDADHIKILGLLRFAERAAVDALAKIPGAARDLLWLAGRSRDHARLVAAGALAGDPDPVVRDWVLATPRELLASDTARRIAEGCALADLLDQPGVDDRRWDQAGNLLLAMTSARNYRSEIHHYDQAATAYRRWVALAAARTPTLERAALLAAVADDLCTGPAARAPGTQRADLLDRIAAILATAPWTAVLTRGADSGDPVAARRAAWAAGRRSIPAERFAVRVVVADPEPVGFPQVEARVVVAGWPVVAMAFDRGPAVAPEELIGGGRLRATEEPHEVMLAEAFCSEGCCGALHVTIVRDGSEVVWKDWRTPMDGPPPELRFDAAAYDREVSRAEQDQGWEWPARTLARLVSERLRADPSILGRWDCSPGWCTAWLKDFDTARLMFLHPARGVSADGLPLQFGLVIDVGDQDPERLAAELIASIRDTDPKSFAEMIGGSKELAERLGLVYRQPTRW